MSDANTDFKKKEDPFSYLELLEFFLFLYVYAPMGYIFPIIFTIFMFSKGIIYGLVFTLLAIPTIYFHITRLGEEDFGNERYGVYR